MPTSRIKLFRISLLLSLAFMVSSNFSEAATPLSTIPFVGCIGGGMIYTPAPTGPPLLVPLPTATAKKLALYAGEHLAILAPRGWQCDGISGPFDETLDVYPVPGNVQSGQAVAISVDIGADLGGAYIINMYGGRFFPKIVSKSDIDRFTSSPNWNGPGPNQFPFPYRPKDQIVYINSRMLEFETPAFYPGVGPSLIPFPSKYTTKTDRFPTFGLIRIFTQSGAFAIETMSASLPKTLSKLKSPILYFAKTCILHDSLRFSHQFCGVTADYPENGN